MAVTADRRASATDAAILEMVRRRTETTRVEIARELGVTAATVTYAVKRLLAADLVVETGFARSNGGKRASLLRVNDRARWAIGCTIGTDRISVVGVDMTGALRSRAVLPLDPDADPAAIAAVLGEALEMMEPERTLPTTTGIGFAIPQAADGRTSALVDSLVQDLPYPTVSASSPTCAALGSFWSGEQPENGLTATIHMDSGVGLAVLRDGEPLPSTPGASLDHVCVDPHGPPCPCGGRGCLHQYASARALVHAATEAGSLAARLGLGLTEQSLHGDSVLIALAAAAGDAAACEVLERALDAIAQASWTIVAALGIESVVLSGACLQAAPGLVRATVGQHVLPRARATGLQVHVQVSQVQPHPGSAGAAVLALRTFMEPRPSRRP